MPDEASHRATALTPGVPRKSLVGLPERNEATESVHDYQHQPSANGARVMRPPVQQDNSIVAAALADYWTAWQACESHPGFDDILSAALAARTGGDSATRSLCRRKLFRILQHCQVITTAAVAELLPASYKSRTVEKYAQAARLASRFAASYFQAKSHPPAMEKWSERVSVTYRREPGRSPARGSEGGPFKAHNSPRAQPEELSLPASHLQKLPSCLTELPPAAFGHMTI